MGVVAIGASATFARWPDPYAPHPAPTIHRQCNDRQPSRVDPAMVAVAFDVTSGQHADGTSATAFACIGHDVSVEVTVDGTGVSVSPSRFVAGADLPPRPLEITVAPGGHGRLRVVGRSRGLGFDLGGPRVVRDGDGWRVEPANV